MSPRRLLLALAVVALASTVPLTSHAALAATTTPVSACAKNHSAKRVIVSIAKQRLWLCAKTKLAFTSAITSGAVGNVTPKGHYAIQRRAMNAVLSPAAGGHYPVKYWVPFIGNSYGFHNAPWQTVPFGDPAATRYGGSHGCIRMPLDSVAHLYNWVRVGTPVDVS